MLNENVLAISHRKFHEHMVNINEVFDKDIELYKPEWKNNIYSIKFDVEDTTYTFSAMEHERSEFAILFYASGVDPFDLKGNTKYAGDVFAGIKKSLHALISDRDVNMFWFNTSEQKLKKLYDVIINRMRSEYKDFEFKGSEIKGNTKFWIFKKRGYNK